MMGFTDEQQRQLELDAWVEEATAVIMSNAEARMVRAQLINHYQEHRMTLEADGWSAPDAHKAALGRLGSPSEAQRVWVQRMGLAEALPWTLGFVALILQISGVAGWRMGVYLSWFAGGAAVLLAGRGLWRALATLVAYWQGQWSKLPSSLILVGTLIGVTIGFEPVWAGQPIWGGQNLDAMVTWWEIPVMLASLAVLAAVTWRGVYRSPTGAWAASGQVGGSAVLGLVLGSAVGFGATWVWLLRDAVLVQPGHVGYLPHWPWQALSYTLSQHMVPAVVILTVWVLGIATMAGKARTRHQKRKLAADMLT